MNLRPPAVLPAAANTDMLSLRGGGKKYYCIYVYAYVQYDPVRQYARRSRITLVSRREVSSLRTVLLRQHGW